MISLAISQGDPQRQASVAQAVHGGRVGGHLFYGVHREEHHRGADAKTPGPAEDGARRDQVRRAVAVEPEMVLGQPDRVEAQ